ncbi:hypothetical protein C8Q78DRAFT_470694 [Trametes maxima]|nr:hypothetical protein C8Q78DRAFT_470694 [Trametes maxima]
MMYKGCMSAYLFFIRVRKRKRGVSFERRFPPPSDPRHESKTEIILRSPGFSVVRCAQGYDRLCWSLAADEMHMWDFQPPGVCRSCNHLNMPVGMTQHSSNSKLSCVHRRSVESVVLKHCNGFVNSNHEQTSSPFPASPPPFSCTLFRVGTVFCTPAFYSGADTVLTPAQCERERKTDSASRRSEALMYASRAAPRHRGLASPSPTV